MLAATAAADPRNLASNDRESMARVNQEFINPPNAYRMLQYARVSQKTDFVKAAAYGMGGIQLLFENPGFTTNATALKELDRQVVAAKKAGLRVWLSDDNGYPSGSSSGLVLKDHPEYELAGLLELQTPGTGHRHLVITLPAGAKKFVVAALYLTSPDEPEKLQPQIPVRVGDDFIETDTPDGNWLLAAFALKVIDKDTQATLTAKQFRTSGRYPNLLNGKADAQFIALSHQRFADALPDLTSNVEAFYTNEPNLMTLYMGRNGTRDDGCGYLPWTDELPGIFQQQHGYDLLPHLHEVFDGDDDFAKTVRCNYYQTVAAVMTGSFSGPIANWCEKHGVSSAGHFLWEEFFALHVMDYGNFMKVMGPQDIPGCDIPAVPALKYPYWYCKDIASIAYINNRDMVNALYDPIIYRGMNANRTPSLDQMAQTISTAYFTGINNISSYIAWSQYPPAEYRHINDYIGRLGVMLRGARNATEIAIYYPIETFQANVKPNPHDWAWNRQEYAPLQKTNDTLAQEIFKSGRDFNYLTPDAVQAAKVENGYLVVGRHRYRSIIMPDIEVISLACLEKLQLLRAGGGKVIWAQRLPRLGVSMAEHAAVQKIAATYTVAQNPVQEAGDGYGKEFRLKIVTPDLIFCGRYLRENSRIYYLVNPSEKIARFHLESSEPLATVKLYNPLDGSIQSRPLPLETELTPGKGVFIVDQ